MVRPERAARLRRVAEQRQAGIVVFEDISDPHNAAAALRSCDAFGFQQAWFVFTEEPPFNPRRVGKSSSASANRWLDFSVYRSLAECLADVRRAGYRSYATVSRDRGRPFFETDISGERIALLFGNEERGLSPAAVEGADERISIPLAGFVESLNLSVTVGICLAEITRRRRAAGFDRYLLPADEREELAARWLEREELR